MSGRREQRRGTATQQTPTETKTEVKTEPKKEEPKKETPKTNFKLHGAYGKREDAEAKSKLVAGSKVEERDTRRGKRFVVVSV